MKVLIITPAYNEEKVLQLTNDPDNDPDRATTQAEEQFESTGILQTVQEEIVSTRNARIEGRRSSETRDERRFIGIDQTSEVTGTRTESDMVSEVFIPPPPPPPAPPPPPQIITIVETVIEEVEVVLWDCILFIPAMISLGPPQYPNRQPVMQYALDTPFIVIVRSLSSGSTSAIV